VLQILVDVDTDDHPDEFVRRDQRGGLFSPTAWGEALRRLDEQYPRLSQWMGGRLDIEVPALAVSLGVHLVLLLSLGMVGYAVHKEVGRRFEGTTGALDTALPNLEKMQFQDLDQTAERPSLTPAAGSFSPNLATVNVSAPASGGPTAVAVADAKAAGPGDMARLNIQRATEVLVPTANMFGQSVSIRGNGAEHVGNAEGAVDRIADEVLRRLEKGRTLVVWAFDSSLSLQVERERLAKHIETIYTHITQLDEKNLAADGGLLTQVVAFGQGRKAVTDAPTADAQTIASAIRSITNLDDTGLEFTFQTVASVVRNWGRYKDVKGNFYRTMVIVVTDEVGDDEDHLEEAIELAGKAKVPIYVLGSQAIFARSKGKMNYTDPKTGHTHYNLEVRQGPESIQPEQIRLPFWYEGNQYDILDSGFGPYALSRLAGATGGIYFVTRLGGTRMGFDPVAMREYKPDWVTRNQYESARQIHPIRNAVIEAALITQQNNLPAMPSLFFPPVDGPEFKQAMEQNQALAARTAYTVDAALEPVNNVIKVRGREDSRRWQAHFDLIRGRLLAVKVRCYEYNWACAKMKKDAPKFTKPDSNAWRLVPDTEIHYSDKAAAAGKQATDLLKKVVAEHPNTPWALLAQRELKDPLGFKWIEVHVRPIVRNNNAGDDAAKKKAQMNAPKPPPPPKL
jgi:uncharacterized protein YegL